MHSADHCFKKNYKELAEVQKREFKSQRKDQKVENCSKRLELFYLKCDRKKGTLSYLASASQ